MTHTTNTKTTAAEVLRGLGIDGATATRAAAALADAGLFAQDLPDPYELDVCMPIWNVGETTVASAPDHMVMVVGNGVKRLFQDLGALDEYALTLLAAVTLSLLPIFFVYLFGRRYLLSGLTAGFGK